MSRPRHEDVWVTVAENLRIYARDYPALEQQDSTPVICIPGLTRNHRDFEELAPWLANRRRVVAVDLRGRGLSDADPEWRRYVLETYVADVVCLLDHLRLDRVVVIGTSLGGLVGMYLAANHPQRVAALVLNDIGPQLDPAGLLRIAASVGSAKPVTDWSQAADEAQRTHGHALPDFAAEDWVGFAKRIYRQRRPGVIERDMDPAIGRALREQQGPLPDFWSVFAALRALPILVLRGASSDLLSSGTLARMQGAHPGLHSCTIARRGHSPTLDEPASRQALTNFFQAERL